MIVLSVPPIDGVVVTPSLARYVDEPMLSGVDVVLLDIGISGARRWERKARRAYEFYQGVLETLSSLETPPSRVLAVVPDSFDLKQHLALAKSWRVYARKLEEHPFKITHLFVVRRFLKGNAVDKYAVRELAAYVEEYRGVAIPANLDTASERDVKCSKEPATCLAHIGAAVKLFDAAEWRHALGPPLASILSRLITYNIDSADTTSHRMDILSRLGTRRPSLVHLLNSYAEYLKTSSTRIWP